MRSRPGSRYGYSNYGLGLLGRVLAEAAGLPYGELLAERVCGPLGLRSTTCAPDAPRLAVGHRRGRPLPPWRMPGLPGAGALRTSGADLLRHLGAHPRGAEGALGAALRDVQRPRLRLPRSADRLGLVRMHRRSGGRGLSFHSGGTRGFTSSVGFSAPGPSAVAVLANTAPANGRAPRRCRVRPAAGRRPGRLRAPPGTVLDRRPRPPPPWRGRRRCGPRGRPGRCPSRSAGRAARPGGG
ncbi:serine hydrolase domain-containing protein [Kitasatospora sp. NPDC101157]|uniref:serine hydrolase domain-containing protein n=1 Tax=Kitasatospora sp. NPDC101157 TaxID=3364098 RepID=UPI0038225B77